MIASLCSTDSDCSTENLQIMGQRPRLPAFQQITGDMCPEEKEEKVGDDLSLCDKKTEVSLMHQDSMDIQSKPFIKQISQKSESFVYPN